MISRALVKQHCGPEDTRRGSQAREGKPAAVAIVRDARRRMRAPTIPCSSAADRRKGGCSWTAFSARSDLPGRPVQGADDERPPASSRRCNQSGWWSEASVIVFTLSVSTRFARSGVTSM